MAMNSVDTSKGRLRGTYIAIMIPIGVAINYIGGLIASTLALPIYMDSIGTVIVADGTVDLNIEIILPGMFLQRPAP